MFISLNFPFILPSWLLPSRLNRLTPRDRGETVVTQDTYPRVSWLVIPKANGRWECRKGEVGGSGKGGRTTLISRWRIELPWLVGEMVGVVLWCEWRARIRFTTLSLHSLHITTQQPCQAKVQEQRSVWKVRVSHKVEKEKGKQRKISDERPHAFFNFPFLFSIVCFVNVWFNSCFTSFHYN